MDGISTQSYRTLFNKVKDGFNSKLGKKVVILILKPYHMNKARNILNIELIELVGELLHFLNTQMIIEKNDEKRLIKLTKVNNFIINVQKLQRAMVKFCDMSTHDYSGKLKFVIKLDENEVIKGHQLERVSLTLMNKALDASIIKKDERYFSAQSKNEIWWLVLFEVSCAF